MSISPEVVAHLAAMDCVESSDEERARLVARGLQVLQRRRPYQVAQACVAGYWRAIRGSRGMSCNPGTPEVSHT